MFYPYIKEAGLSWMMPIVFLSFCALAFCLERSWYWVVQSLHSRKRGKILEMIFQLPFQVDRAMEACRETWDIVALTLREFLLQYQEVSLDIAERKTRLFAEAKVEESRHFLDLLSLIASISGTLGLMGTVVGISLSFKSMAQDDSKGIALSLSTAMYTTIGGIVLFLLSYLFWFFFQKFSDSLENELEVNIQKLKDMLEIEQKSKLLFPDEPPIVLDHGEKAREMAFSNDEEEHQVIKDFSMIEQSEPVSEEPLPETSQEEQSPESKRAKA